MPANPEHSENSTQLDDTLVDATDITCVTVGDLSGLELVRLGVARMRADMVVADSAELVDVMVEVECVKRQAHALSIDVLQLCAHFGLHYQDGHSSPHAMMRHVNKLRPGQATARGQCHKMFRSLPLIADAYRTGSVGTDQVELLARVFANVRVRGAMQGRQEWFLEHARALSFKRFQRRVLNWEQLIDQDGTEPAGDRTAANRNARSSQDPTDLSWDLQANFTSVDGAINNRILDAFTKVLFDADWAEAKNRVGDGVCMADLARTAAQRRSDALTLIFAVAANSDHPLVPAKISHDIVWSASTHEEMARRWAGAKPRAFDVDDYRCETIDGDPLDPTEAFASSVVNKIRRVIVNANGVVIDLGTARRFTGLARDAVRLSQNECYWPGCEQPATSCETDHLDDHANGGRTNPGNGAPACGRHNRWKQKGYTVRRDPTGRIRVHRPNGTEIL